MIYPECIKENATLLKLHCYSLEITHGESLTASERISVPTFL